MWLRRVSVIDRLLGILILVLFLPGVYLTVADLTPAPHQEDFGAYYVAARALATGQSPYDERKADVLAMAAGVEHHSPYIYPPLLALVIGPLAALPYRAAAAIWLLLSAGALFAALRLLRTVVQLPWRLYWFVCAAVLFLPPVHHTLQHGQINHVLLLFIVAGAVGGAGAAVLVGAAAALKIFPMTLAIVYGLSGRVGALMVMVVTAAALTLGGALLQPAATTDFAQRVGPALAIERRLAPNNQSAGAVTARWFERDWFVEPIVHAPAVGRLASYVASAVVIAVTLWALWSVRRVEGAMTQPGRFSLVLTATLIVSPIVWDHYYVLLLLPAAVLYRCAGDRMVRVLLLAGTVLLLSHRYWPAMLATKSPLFMSEGLAGVVLLWIAMLKVVSYDRVCAVRPSPSAGNRSPI
jgi:Glycosyltransferase family 87